MADADADSLLVESTIETTSFIYNAGDGNDEFKLTVK